MADPIPLGPQPNTLRMVQSIQNFTEELTKFVNVPALTEGNGIQNAIVQLTTQMNQKFDQLNNKIDTLAARMMAK